MPPITVRLQPPVVAALPALEQKLNLDYAIDIPGGTSISMPSSFGPGMTECRLIVDYMLPSITLAMAPFGFIFCIANVVLKIKAVLDAVLDAIGGDASAFNTALSDLATALSCVTSAIPAVSVPILIKDVIDYLDAMLSCLIDALNNIQTNTNAINAALADAPEGSDLQATLQAALANQNAAVEAMNVQLKPLQPIIAVMNIMTDLISVSPISFSQPGPGTSLSALITALQGLQTTLSTLKSALP